ncbi:hypothetical protein Q8G41_27980, partial [Klebsiella pneumoniae]|uniref:hypothetical protein n=1 Tax=Klebsiella pneumoniae TaxID=573 RepID=UPI00301321A9
GAAILAFPRVVGSFYPLACNRAGEHRLKADRNSGGGDFNIVEGSPRAMTSQAWMLGTPLSQSLVPLICKLRQLSDLVGRAIAASDGDG